MLVADAARVRVHRQRERGGAAYLLVQLFTPDEKRGRVSAVNSLFIGTPNELGGFDSGVVAHWLEPVFSVVSGGVSTLLVVVAVALLWPEVRRYGRLVPD